MFWIITKDHINGKTAEDTPKKEGYYSTTGIPLLGVALSAATDEAVPHILKGLTDASDHEFRLYDDDGVLYYEGVCNRLDKATESAAFEPLDWAAMDVGCTRMDYRKKGETEWKTL